MRIEQFEFVNYCQFRHFAATLPAGLIAIVGPNGSGKSNLLGGLGWLLTGDNPNVGKNEHNISQFSVTGERAYGRMTFVHGSTRATVIRNLYPASPAAELHEEGRTPLVGAVPVTNRICEILGTSAEVIHDLVIVAQDEIFGFLDKIPSKRAADFQKLFRTEAAAVVNKLLDKEVARLQATPAAVDIARLRADYEQHAERSRQLELALQGLGSVADCDAAIATNEAVIRAADDAARARGLLAAAAVRVSAATGEYQRLDGLLGPARNTVAGLVNQVEILEQAAVTARATLEAAGVYKRHADHARSVQGQHGEAVRRLAGLFAPQSPPLPPGVTVDAQIATLTASKQDVDTRCHAAEKTRKEMELAIAAPIARCPSCRVAADPGLRIKEAVPVLVASVTAEAMQAWGNTLSAIAQLEIPDGRADPTELMRCRDEATATLQALLPEQQSVAASLFLMQKYKTDEAAYQRNRAELTAAISGLEAQLAQLGEVRDPGDPTIARAAVAAADKAKADLAAATTNRDALERQFAAAGGTLTTTINARDAQAAVVAALPPNSDEQAVQARQFLEAWQQQRHMRTEYEKDLAVARYGMTHAQSQIQAQEAAAAAVADDKAWHDHIAPMVELTHHSAAARFVAQQNLQRLQAYVNEYLTMFQAEFRVIADEGLSFVAHFLDGVRRQPADRLSGGQKVVLAIAFRLATNLSLAAGVGALYLDEPTAYLDRTHIRGFEPALARLREFSTAGGLQCIIVTHETALAPLFDAVVTLETSR